MTPDELLQCVAQQESVTIRRTVSVWGPELASIASQRGGMRLTDVLAHPDQRREQRDFRYGHLVGRGLPRDTVSTWQAHHSGLPLPDDLRDFLTVADGLHLWADLDVGRGYVGILPLAEWTSLDQSSWGHAVLAPTDGQVAMSYHDNGALYLALDTSSGAYLWYDTEDIDAPKTIASSVPDLLDFWWDESARFDPRRGRAGS